MVDLDCFDDLHPFADEIDDPIAELAQDIYHRLIETPGSNIDDPDRGLGIEEALSGPFDPTLASRIDAEIQKDARVDVSQTTILDMGGGTFRVDIRIQFNEEELGLIFINDAQGFRRAT